MVQTQVPVTHTQQTAAEEKQGLHTVIPPVDIIENKDNIQLVADIPGIEKDQLEISVENGTLTLHATNKENKPANQVYREFHPVNYYRQFNISDRIKTESISADLKNGVLTLTLPKQEEAKPKKIEVKTA
jgi:HSP20 family molecular chaperone IbpA